MVLNEPETSLHPDLLPPLARMIALVAARTQVVVVSHAVGLIRELESRDGCNSIRLEKSFGETTITSASPFATWHWAF